MGGMYGILIQNFSGYNNEDLKNLPPPPPGEDKELEQPDEAIVYQTITERVKDWCQPYPHINNDQSFRTSGRTIRPQNK